MSGAVRAAQQLFGKLVPAEQASVAKSASTIVRDFTRYAEGDQVLLNGRRLSSPLKRDKSSPVPNGNGSIQHNDILGQPLSTLRIDGADNRYVTVQYPSLDQYVSMTRRNVTPIYSSYASTVVSLLDLHVHPPTTDSEVAPDSDRVDILEAGTGHGSLTLHLARAIAVGNAPQPVTALPRGRQSSLLQAVQASEELPDDVDPEWSAWFRSRRAVVNTVENVSKNSTDAEKLIRGFRQGLYWPHIDFYASGVDDWIDARLVDRDERDCGFLTHVILDMPGVENMLSRAAAAMQEDAKLIVFCPSITQVAECQKLIKQDNLPLVLEKAVELGEGISTGRIWDVRIVTPRPPRLLRHQRASDSPHESADPDTENSGSTSEDQAFVEERQKTFDESSKMVCRPKVGELTFGGGFLGLWRKSTFKKPTNATETAGPF
ncbi:uncharacterized protein HMPREF1541_08179 [Cyphellophora europaea CBS 101466]|uniref:tRNA (adenine(58)-N(1))-methyltransferase catalytic subunit TRM61 n=1 Tax=Cyphellophora europaea (strain CBS 101466) TaxID=1220924 RepID=W2RN68_CYPE1|nr:uncharacterized protein HMPREF1541_08179 [Cyphellophora europaea CBS 101466]ETN37189.1 hypothetical protein HMPREF1541_08179 [Cyphellophora europaea CBS 101466]